MVCGISVVWRGVVCGVWDFCGVEGCGVWCVPCGVCLVRSITLDPVQGAGDRVEAVLDCVGSRLQDVRH